MLIGFKQKWNLRGSGLVTQTLRAVGLRVSFVVLMGSFASYLYASFILKQNTVDTLEKYVAERAMRESAVLGQARDFQNVVRSTFQKELQSIDSAKAIKEFDELFYQASDLSWRKKPSTELGEFGFFGKRGLRMTPELKIHIFAWFQVIRTLGPAWNFLYKNLYVSASEGYGVIFWPDLPEQLKNLAPDYDLSMREPFWAADRIHNPNRQTVSTGLYLDIASREPMVSILTPVDEKSGAMHFVIGQDILMSQLIERSTNDTLKGTYNMIFRSDGQLISHPTLLDEIKKGASGHIEKIGDNHLLEIYKIAKAKSHGVEELKHFDELIAVAAIPVLDWRFVTIYPKKLLRGMAIQNAVVIISLGFISLLIELLILRTVFRKKIVLPIQKLAASLGAIKQGNYQSRLTEEGDNEISKLVLAYNELIIELDRRQTALNKHTEELESLVEARTTELALVRAKAEHGARLSALGIMAAGIAHEINNPLAIILGHSKILEGQLAKQEFGREGLFQKSTTIITETAKRIASIVKALLTFGRDGEKDPMVPIKIRNLIDDAVDICRIKFLSAGIEIRRNLEQENLEIECRVVQIAQILLNLLNNSYDAVMGCQERWIQFEILAQVDVINIAVVDSGQIIPDEVAAHLMQPFFTTKAVNQGTGLGLCVSLGIAQSHGGTLYLDRAVNHTRFVLVLPRPAQGLAPTP